MINQWFPTTNKILTTPLYVHPSIINNDTYEDQNEKKNIQEVRVYFYERDLIMT